MTQAPSDPAPEPIPPAPRTPDGLALVALIGTLATGGAFITVGALSQLANVGFGLWWAEVFVFFGVPYVVLRLFGFDAFRTAGLGAPWLKGIGVGFAAGVINFFALVVPLQVVSQKVAQTVAPGLLEAFDISGIFRQQTPIELALVISGVCLAAPLCEEFCFRGMMQRGAEKTLGPVRALIVTSVVFSVFHLDPIGLLARIELGLLFGWLMWKTGSIWPGLFAHLANNTVSVGLYFLSRGEKDDELIWWVPVLMLLVGGSLLYLLLEWAQHLSAPVRAEDTEQPTKGLGLTIAGAAAVALLAIGGLMAVDARGVQLNFVDAFVPLKAPKEADDLAAQAQWDALVLLRKQVRAGDGSLEEYSAARRTAKADRATPNLPAPKTDFQF